MNRKAFRVVFAVCVTLMSSGWGDDFPKVYDSPSEAGLSPLDAATAADSMELPPGFSATVFAAEPEVRNPIAMAWDQAGRMWVAENYTYSDRTQRFDLNLRDRVVVFRDTDQDGHADERHVFLDTVQRLTSVEVGRGGVWLLAPPQLLFVPDADGDAKPDGPAVVKLDGFTVAKSNYHNFANGLRWGPDGWLYGRSGHSCPGELGIPGTPDSERVPIKGGIWRFHPERNVVEVLCHGTVNPWGHDWDRDGELFFINTVIGHLWHMMPGAHFKESFGESSNPMVYERLDMIADHYHFDTNGSWTASRDGKANDLGGGHAHIGMMIYQGTQWPVKYHNKLFTVNMHGLRVNVERLERQGAGYVGRHEPDFLISKDPFFRGLDIRTGPDGHAYVIDWSDTGECHDSTGVHRTSGRIFRLAYSSPLNSSQATAVRKTTLPFAKPTCMAGPGELPKLWKSFQAGNTTALTLRQKLHDPDEHVRAWAIRLLTDAWPLDTLDGPMPSAVYPAAPETSRDLIAVSKEDSSGLVLLTLASTLQRIPVQQRPALAEGLIVREDYRDDRDLPSMVWFGLSPVVQSNPGSLIPLVQRSRWPSLTGWIARAIADQHAADADQSVLNELLVAGQSVSRDHQLAILAGMQKAFEGERKITAPADWNAFAGSIPTGFGEETIRQMGSLFGDGRAMEQIRQVVLDKKRSIAVRQRALQHLIEARPNDLREICESLLDVRVLNKTALRGLALYNDPKVGALLIRKYQRFQPEDRQSVLEVLVSRPAFAESLLKALGKDKSSISAADIRPQYARQIKSLNIPALTSELSKVWGDVRETSAERQQQMLSLKKDVTPTELQQADLSAGRALFKATCTQCHRLYGEGESIGPDLTGAQRTNLDYLLEHIVDPSAVVGKEFRMSVVLTVDGRVLNGLIVSEDKQSLVLQTPNQRMVLPQSEIESVSQTSKSSMPDGLLDRMSKTEVRDLFAYLMHSGQVALPATQN
ncbi:Cytochrome c [Roseimaritima multifibrata]|uniref:Cytochrome c n=1 Tax=Roseimaritima multifibrata TaxID=1930274 RepID=A0A517MFF2_9BACT|nr:PVC-type heme-binding CxxCH protein [Roseimaritima multifibrata]QDS93615.1 Cytochrome c [Roseimaritima multifibrata]